MSELNPLAKVLIAGFERDFFRTSDKNISVNPLVAEMASWYEKFRTAMDYREDEVILRSSIERILKRRFLFEGNGGNVAAPLIRELVWARYFADESLPESIVDKVEDTINLYLQLEKRVNELHRINKAALHEWILHILSSEIEDILQPSEKKELMCNFIYQIFHKSIEILDDTEETRDAQVYIAARRAYGKEDLALLRYALFKQFFGRLTEHNIDKIAQNFLEGYKMINYQLNYPLKDRIYNYIKKQSVPFFILEDVLRQHKDNLKTLLSDQDALNLVIINACQKRYTGIADKVKRAIIRAVIFIFFTKALFALSIEGTFESLIYGKIMWGAIALNTLIPPLLMIVVGMMIKIPGRENSIRILKKINIILFENPPILSAPLEIQLKPKKTDPILDILFVILWVLAIVVSFGGIIFILSTLHFNVISQFIFIFFLAIVSFMAYRINQIAHMYVIKEGKEGLGAVLFDFFFMPFIQIGRNLTLGISQINIFLYVFDYIIETPFKNIFAFLEQWFLYLRTQREKLD